MEYPSLYSIPRILQDYDFCLTWAIEVELTPTKAETIIKSYKIIQTTRDKISKISHHIIKSFFLWFLNNKYIKYMEEAKKELKTAMKLAREWEAEVKVLDHTGYYQDYVDGIEYVTCAMKILLEGPEMMDDNLISNLPEGRVKAGVLHVKQEFFRPFIDEIDRRIGILVEIRRLNNQDSRACLYLAKSLGQKRKMENFISVPGMDEMNLLVEGFKKAKSRDYSTLTELCYCLAQLLRHNKVKRFPLMLYNSMVFRTEKSIADFINTQTTAIWKDTPDAAPLYVKLAEIQSSLLPNHYKHPKITALVLVNKALVKYPKYSKALHRKAKILFKLKNYEEGLKCLEAAFTYEETNSHALCDLVYRLMRFPNEEKLQIIFEKYCTDHGENLWGKRKVGTLYYLCGCHHWMMNDKVRAIHYWLQAEKHNPNPTFYFEHLYTQKTNYKWHKARLLVFEDIIKCLRSVELSTYEDRETRDLLISKLKSLIEK